MIGATKHYIQMTDLHSDRALYNPVQQSAVLDRMRSQPDMQNAAIIGENDAVRGVVTERLGVVRPDHVAV